MGMDTVLVVLIVVLVIVVLVQGPKNLPKLGSALGRSISDFRKEVSPDEKPADQAAPTGASTTTAPPPTTPTPPTDPPSA
jgi:TatA/E family protein of Tat protein translocase